MADVADATKDDFKNWVREFRGLDQEIKDAGVVMTSLRKKRKALDQNILTWMQAHKINKVNLDQEGKQVLMRFEKDRQEPVNGEWIATSLARTLGDENAAARHVAAIYDNRPTERVEFLKVTKPTAKARVRPVGDE